MANTLGGVLYCVRILLLFQIGQIGIQKNPKSNYQKPEPKNQTELQDVN